MHNYKNIIYLGLNAQLRVNLLASAADYVWLVDASAEMIEQLQNKFSKHPNISFIQALVDREHRSGTFYEYNLTWANGIKSPNAAIQRLYPGLFCVDSKQQMTTDINELVCECLGLEEFGESDSLENLLIIDLGDQAQLLLDSLHESGKLLFFSTVTVVPSHGKSSEISIPPSLHGPLESGSAILSGLPIDIQVFARHPLALEHHWMKCELQHAIQQLSQFAQERDAKSKKLAQTEQAMEELKKELAEVVNKRDEVSQQLESTKRQLLDNQQQVQEKAYRQQLIDQEVLKAETQLDFIKEIMMSDKAF